VQFSGIVVGFHLGIPRKALSVLGGLFAGNNSVNAGHADIC